MLSWKVIISKYSGTCKHPECKESFTIGDRVLWRAGYGAMCTTHGAKESTKQLTPRLVTTNEHLPTAGGNLPVRVAYGWQEVERPAKVVKTRAEYLQEDIPTRAKHETKG